jgi:hypothetical protein
MLAPLRTSAIPMRASALLATALSLSLALGGCGTTAKTSSSAARGAIVGLHGSPSSCPATVLDVLGRVARRIYREGISSERTAAARHLIAASSALRQAVEHAEPVAARAAAQTLVASGHLTNLRVLHGGRVLADVGGAAVAPFGGPLTGAGGQPIGSYLTSVWSDEGLLAETDGVTGSALALRASGRSVGGSFALPPGKLAPEGTLTRGGLTYQYTSFGGRLYPSGALGLYLLKPLRSTHALCGASVEETVVNTLARIANLIYAGEAGARTLPQIRRVQQNQPLLQAVARRDQAATKAAIEALLTEHIVRLRVSVGGRLLDDVGGPFVLAPVSAPLRLGGRTIGTFVLSIQDDEGYLRLTRRLAGLRVLMYMEGDPTHLSAGPTLVKNSLGPEPGTVPPSGSYVYRGQRFRVVTVDASAFPSGLLTIRVLVPIPYS